MPRRAGPWFRKSRGEWFATLNGRQIPLNITDPNDRAAADTAFAELVARLAAALPAGTTGTPARKEPTAPARTVAEAVTTFLAKKAAEVERGRFSAGSLKQYRIALETHLVRTFGTRAVASVTADELEEWADRPAWSDTTRNNRLGAVGTFLAWAKVTLDRELVRPPKESRGAETVLTDDQFAKVLAGYDPRYGGGDFRELLTVLRETGARPQECARLAVEGIDWPNTCARLKEHKTKRHGTPRVLYFSKAAMEVLEAQREKHGAGFLFRNRAGRPYSEKNIKDNMQRISKRVGFRAIAYGLGRHSFATKALCSGVPDIVVAKLLGHGSTRMVHSNYGHVGEQSRVLRDAVQKVSENKAG